MATWNEVLSGEGSPDHPLTAAYRIVRVLGAGEGPIPGVLAHGPDGAVVLVDAARLAGWAGWELPGQHVLSPVDVARTASGHQAVVAWCPNRITDDWARGSISGGEAVTLAVSLLRGASEARRSVRGTGEGPPGRWWADAAGRPVFAPSVATTAADDPSARGEGAAAGARRLLGVVAEGIADRVVRRLLERAVDVLADSSRLGRELESLEAELFEACAPQPLSFAADGGPAQAADPPTTRVVTAETGRLRRDHAGRRGGDRVRARQQQERRKAPAAEPTPRATRRRERPRAGGDGARLEPRALAEEAWSGRLGTAVSDVLFHLRASARRLSGGRRAAYVAGGAAAVAVLLVGLLWPSGEPTAVADEGAPAATSSESEHDDPATTPEPEPTEGASEGSDGVPEPSPTKASVEAEPADAARRLIERAADCAETHDDECTGTIEPGSRALRSEEGVWARLRDAELTLSDDYGGVALVRADAGDEAGSHYLILVQRDGRWLLRDAYASA